mmetsp:Transcript_29234/g.62061  ORF Transcript_29234/g.62061 Transcript_29234/m.62061 type:complete len:239 (-) Transcript_29234:1017-1733(-)
MGTERMYPPVLCENVDDAEWTEWTEWPEWPSPPPSWESLLYVLAMPMGTERIYLPALTRDEAEEAQLSMDVLGFRPYLLSREEEALEEETEEAADRLSSRWWMSVTRSLTSPPPSWRRRVLAKVLGDADLGSDLALGEDDDLGTTGDVFLVLPPSMDSSSSAVWKEEESSEGEWDGESTGDSTEASGVDVASNCSDDKNDLGELAGASSSMVGGVALALVSMVSSPKVGACLIAVWPS